MKKNDSHWLQFANSLSEKCTPVSTAYCVGAVIIDKDGNKIASAYSRETEKGKHAEEIAIERALAKKVSLNGSTIYSSLEPCGERLSGKKTCVESIIASGIKRVVFGAYEPPKFVKGEGEELLKKAGIETIYLETESVISIQ